MAWFAWLAMRQAQEALKHGRLEEALRFLSQPHAQDRRGAAALVGKLARAFVERGERSLRKDDPDAAWRDLLHAEHLQTPEKSAEHLRDALTRLGTAEVRALLQAGEPGRAEEVVARLRGKLVPSPELHALDEGARGWLSARDQAGRGEFPRAVETVDRVRRLLPNVGVLDEYRKDLDRKLQTFGALLVQLHEAANGGRGAEVIQAAERHGLVRFKGKITVEDKNGTNTIVVTSYINLHEHQTRDEHRRLTADGEPGKLVLIHVVHESSRRTLMIYPEDKTVYLGTQSSENSAKPFLEQLRELQGDKLTTKEKEKLDGSETLKYKFEKNGRTSTVWVDAKSNLPLRIDFTVLHPLGIRSRLVLTDFEWDPRVADRAELFSLILPEGYKVVWKSA